MKKLLVFIGIIIIVLFSANIMAAELDLGVTEVDLEKYYPSDTEYIIISGRVKNYGTQTVNNFKINYQINDGEIIEYSFTAIIAPNTDRRFEHPEPIEPITGFHTIKVWSSLPNGQDDEIPANDAKTFEVWVYNINNIVPHTILVEGFSSSTCGPCLSGNIHLKTQLEQNQGLFALIKYQLDFPSPGDPYFTSESGAKRNYYSFNSVPFCAIDGSVWQGISGAVTQKNITDVQAIPVCVLIEVDYYVEGQTIYTKVNINSREYFSGQDLRLNIAVVEKVTHKNVGNNGETEFHQIMKKFIPDTNGIEFGDLTAGITYSTVQEWEFKGDYRLPNNASSPINHLLEHSVENFDNLTIVAWIQNSKTKIVTQAANGVNTESPSVEFTCLNSEYGTISATVNGESISSGDFVNHGDNIVFTASPAEEYEVKEWLINGEPYTSKIGNSIEIPANNFIVLSVEFQEKSNINKQLLSVPVFYPNPFTNNLTITNVEKVTAVTITNLLGQTVKTTHFTGTSTVEINTADLAEGIYIITLHSLSGEKTVHKIAKQKK